MESEITTDLRAWAAPLTIFLPIAIALGNFVSEATVIAIAVLFLIHSLQRQDFAWAREPWFALLLILWAYSVLRSLAPPYTLTGIGTSLAWIRFILFAAALASWILPDEATRRRMTIAAIVAVSFMACDALLQYVFGHDIIGRPREISGRLTAEFARPMVGIEIAWLFLPPLLGLMQWRRWMAAMAFGAVTLAAVLLSGERLALLFSVAGLLATMIWQPNVRRWLVVLLPVAVLAMAAMFYLRPAIYQRQVVSTVQTASNVGESHYGIIWSSALRMAWDNPILGVGVRNFAQACLDPKYGPELIGPDHFPRCVTHPHNNYLEWLVETGVIGLAVYIAAVLALMTGLGRLLWKVQAPPILIGVAVTLALRFWPLQSNTSFYIAWSAVPMFLMIGWGLSYRGKSGITQ